MTNVMIASSWADSKITGCFCAPGKHKTVIAGPQHIYQRRRIDNPFCPSWSELTAGMPLVLCVCSLCTTRIDANTGQRGCLVSYTTRANHEKKDKHSQRKIPIPAVQPTVEPTPSPKIALPKGV